MATLTQQRPTPKAVPTNGDATLDRIAALYREPEWLTRARRDALAAYAGSALPDRVTHLWRYTAPEQFIPQDGAAALAAPSASGKREFPSVLADELGPESVAAAAYIREGLVWKTAVDEELSRAGLLIMDLHEGARQKPELVQQHLGSLIGADFGKFEAFTNAAWSGGLLVYVPRGLELSRPVHLVTAQPVHLTDVAGRLLVIVDEGASLTLIDEYGDGAAASIPQRTHHIVEAFVGRGARFTYAPIQNWNRNTTSYMTQRARLDSDARIDVVMTSMGGASAKVDCGTILSAPGGESNIYGLAIGDQSQRFDHHTVHRHASGRTRSDLKFKVALRDNADSVYTGLIRIDEKSAFCEAYQENRNLILSPKAKAESIPELEILNNEVRCSHGATVGRIDEQEIFYCESRGIDRAEAIRLIVAGFIEPIVQHVPDIAQSRLRSTIIRRLEER
ncbi:MAG TPA: Fe-S cluster assembly protein SufD [candidate division Zixibacteria bacterium]|jgi:Fe-S cluster assembly protein SufD